MSMLRNYRSFAVFATVAAVVAALAFLFGSAASGPKGAIAAGSPTKATSCADIYQDIDNDTTLWGPHDGDDKPAATSMTRLDVPSQTGGDADLTTVTYLGPDLVPGDDHATGGATTGNDTDEGAGVVSGDLIPDVAPAIVDCATSTTNANTGAEAGTFHARMGFANQYGNRPSLTLGFGTYDATNSEDGGAASTCGNGTDQASEGGSAYGGGGIAFDETDTDCYDFPGSSPDTLVGSGCAYSEGGAYWGRTDVFTKVVNKTAKTVNYGRTLLWVFTAVPTTGLIDTNGDGTNDAVGPLGDPNECSGGLGFPAVSESMSREPATDQGTGGKNSGLAADPDGSTLGDRDTSDGLADDWDGDGCTDWDELDKNFTGSFPVSVAGPVNGTDPFNPNDCDTNLDSNISILTTISRDNSNAFLGTGNGNYFKCLASFADPKGGGSRTIAIRLGCYSDSPLTVVNSSYADAGGNATCPPAPSSMCGDGKAGGGPPSAVCLPSAGNCTGAYIDIDTAQYPVVTTDGCGSPTPANCYDPGTNSLSLGGCFAGFGGVAFGPNVYGSGSFDTRVGAGAFTIRIGITSGADCADGPPFATGTDIVGVATYVELGSKKTLGGSAIPVTGHKNSDRDGCTDTQELRSAQGDGGQRDPYNSYDYMNPTGDKLNRVDDILATVGEYFDDDPSGDIDYASATDRTGIPGANAWNVGPPNGQQRIDDILASVKQYFHDCND
jgi:hypothetical protein